MTVNRAIDWDAVIRLTREGWTANRIAERLGCTSRSVHRIRGRLDCRVHGPYPKFSADEYHRAEQLLDDGASVREVAQTLGRSEDCIHNHFPGRGWTLAQVAEFAALRRKELGLV